MNKGLKISLDGFDPASVPPTVVELVALAVLVLAHKKLAGEYSQGSVG